MKIISVADSLLISMCKRYLQNGDPYFYAPDEALRVKNIPSHVVYEAFYLLRDDGFISLLSADDIPQEVRLLPDAIRHCDEQTMLKRGYRFIKELREWF